MYNNIIMHTHNTTTIGKSELGKLCEIRRAQYGIMNDVHVCGLSL
jgi:hypothetical protein